MNSKILIIAIAIAVIATVFMGCAKNNNDMTTTTIPSSETTVSDTSKTTDNMESEASSAVSNEQINKTSSVKTRGFIYIICAKMIAPKTVSIPDTAIERLLIAPSTSPSSIALAVPIACEDVPIAIPLAIG